MANFWRVVNSVLNKSDLILIVADARLPEESLNSELLNKIEKANKKYIIVFNKTDLLDKEGEVNLKRVLKMYDFTLAISAKKHSNNMSLLRKINAISGGKHVTVGVVGYPNTGKSSLINSLKGRSSAPVSSRAGFTRSLQKVRASSKVSLIDTPGVIPYEERNDLELQTLLSSKNPEELRDPEGIVMSLIENLRGTIETHYGVKIIKDFDETLENIAEELNLKKKGDIPDTKRAAVRIIQDWQKGKIKN